MSTRLIEAEYIWRDGEMVPWRDATLHVLSLAVQFGSSVFEGIRCYRTPDGPAIFRLGEHIARLQHSCRVYRMDVPHSASDLAGACTAVVERNGLEECYLRPVVLRGYGSAGMNPIGSPVETYVPCWPWGVYLGEGAMERGVDVGVSSWQRQEPNTFPSSVKSAGHYNAAQLVKMEAVANGYADAIALGPGGLVSEGSGANVLLVQNGVLITPATDGTFLSGITRDTVLTLAGDLGIPVREQAVPREMLYSADELFFTGTAAEITPVRSVDRIPVGSGRPGPVTKALQERFARTVRGELPDERGWLTHVRQAVGAMPSGGTLPTAR